jgi:UDP-3-O-[3-hydroxymyristoyl] N-acetylglucosamine deacetylase
MDWPPLSSLLRQQRTISRPVSVEGFGYWSGRDVRVEFRPAPPGSGIVFARLDLQPPRYVGAIVCNRVDVPLRTCLVDGHARVDMVEHILAALSGLNVDNCEVWVDSAEMPGCDGSALPFVSAIDEAGIQEQDAVRHVLQVDGVVRVGDEQCWVEAQPAATGGLSLECCIDYGARGPIGRQGYELTVTPSRFRSELASARTFILEQEAEWLRSQGLGARVTCRDLLVFNDQGPMDNTLRFSDECVRHKTLDLVGDLALAGCDLVGHFVAHCSGHRLNAELVSSLLAQVRTVHPLKKTA